MKSNITKLLPLIIIFFAVVGVLAYMAKNQPTKEKAKPQVVSPSQLESDKITISPTPKSFFFQTETDEPTPIPTTSEVKKGQSLTGAATAAGSLGYEAKEGSDLNVVTTKTTICTPVYGMADTCTEHIVVDTGAESAVAYSFSALSYLGGLIAFVKSKKA